MQAFQLIEKLSELPPNLQIRFSGPGRDCPDLDIDRIDVMQNVDVMHAPFVQVDLTDVLL